MNKEIPTLEAETSILEYLERSAIRSESEYCDHYLITTNPPKKQQHYFTVFIDYDGIQKIRGTEDGFDFLMFMSGPRDPAKWHSTGLVLDLNRASSNLTTEATDD